MKSHRIQETKRKGFLEKTNPKKKSSRGKKKEKDPSLNRKSFQRLTLFTETNRFFEWVVDKGF